MIEIIAIFLWLKLILASEEISVKKTFNPELLKIVDKIGDNYLVRDLKPGNYPSKSWIEITVLDIDYVKNEIRGYAIKEGHLDFPTNFSFNTLNLESYDFPWVLIEYEFFKKHPEIGTFHNWPILGTTPNASEVSEQLREGLLKDYKDWDEDLLPKRMISLRNMMEEKYDKPAVFYIHCFLGHDRAGELSGAYMMKYLSWQFPNLWWYSNHIIPDGKERRMVYPWAAMMNWYCFYLQYSEGVKLDCNNWNK